MSKKLKKIQNKKEIDFINSLPTISIEDTDDKLTEKCKFNFHYLSNNPPATTISEYGSDLLEKLKIFSQHSLSYWDKNCLIKIYTNLSNSIKN